MTEQSRRLLVTTDGSARSHLILPHAAAFARAWRAEVVLCQVRAGDDTRPEQALRAELSQALQRAGVEGRVLLESTARGEDVADALLRVAREQGAGMLALTSRGHGALRHALFGSVAMELVRRSTLPVMAGGDSLGLANRPDGPYRLLVTSDGSHASGAIVHALRPVLITPDFHVTLLRVFGPNTHEGDPEVKAGMEQLRLLASQLEGRGPVVETRARPGVPVLAVDTAIIETAREIGAGAIALSTFGYNVRRHLIAGSTATLLLGRSPLPLILARAE